MDVTLMGQPKEHDLAGNVLERLLASTDIAILSTAYSLRCAHGSPPTAAEIRRALAGGCSLKKTQVYDRLRHLVELGFMKTGYLTSPRTYFVDEGTLLRGSAELLRRENERLQEISLEIHNVMRFFERLTVDSVASVLLCVMRHERSAADSDYVAVEPIGRTNVGEHSGSAAAAPKLDNLGHSTCGA